MEKGKCENCGARPRSYTEGEFAGMQGDHDYCALCSKDLCDECMAKPTCDKGVLCGDTGPHKPSAEAEGME